MPYPISRRTRCVNIYSKSVESLRDIFSILETPLRGRNWQLLSKDAFLRLLWRRAGSLPGTNSGTRERKKWSFFSALGSTDLRQATPRDRVQSTPVAPGCLDDNIRPAAHAPAVQAAKSVPRDRRASSRQI